MVATMLIEGVEHVCIIYDDDTGRGLTLCQERIGPQDIGPRLDEEVTCEKCLEPEMQGHPT